jgi:hypothetical protein
MTAVQACFDFKPITMQREDITHDWFVEARRLLELHWDECACWKDKISLAPDEEKYLAAQKAGMLFLFTMRQGTDMLGYMIVMFSNHLHYKNNVFAYVDVLFIDPNWRKGLAAVKFMKWVEARVKEFGADVMTYHIKTFHDYPALFKRLGFDEIEVLYAKYLKKEK